MNNYVDQTINRYKLEEVERWREWKDKIPTLELPPDWLITVTPPFAGALVRFEIRHKDNDKIFVSVYLDVYERLGCFGGPYWEIYPHTDDVVRCAIDDPDQLLVYISESIEQQKANLISGKEARQSI